MADLSGFDASKVEPNKFDVIPGGEYDAIITDSTVEDNSKGTGKFLKLKLQILSGKFQNRILFDNLNLWHPNAQTVQIAKGTLSSICRAVGILQPNESAELHSRPLKITVRVKNDPVYGPGNEIKGYKSRHVGPQTPAPAAPTQQVAAAPAASQQPAMAATQQPW